MRVEPTSAPVPLALTADGAARAPGPGTPAGADARPPTDLPPSVPVRDTLDAIHRRPRALDEPAGGAGVASDDAQTPLARETAADAGRWRPHTAAVCAPSHHSFPLPFPASSSLLRPAALS